MYNLLENDGGLISHSTGTTGDHEDAIYAGLENRVRDISDTLVSPINDLSKTLSGLKDSIATDMVGLESRSVNPEVVRQSIQNYESIMAIGANATTGKIVGLESIDRDPTSALQAGLEAKEGMVKKIIRKIKDFIKSQISRVKELVSKVMATAKLGLVNAKKLKDKADELEDSEEVSLSKEDDLNVHDKFIKNAGVHLDTSKEIKENVEALISAIGAAYEEPVKTKIDGVITHIKNDNLHMNFKGFENAVTKIKGYGDALPSTSAVRKLANDDKVIGGIVFNFRNVAEMVALKSSGGKDPKYTVEIAREVTKTDGVTYEKKISGADIKILADSLIKAFNNYKAVDVVSAIHDRLRTIDKDVSEATKNTKAKYTDRIMKFVSFYNTVGNKSIKAVITAQKVGYSTVKLLVNNAE